MPVAFKAQIGEQGATSGSAVMTITLTAAIAVGDLVVVRIAYDNLSATTPTFSVADSGTNTYTVHRQGAVNATAAAGVAGAIACAKATTVVNVGGTITVTGSGSVAARAGYAETFTGVDNTVRSTAVSATGASTTAASPASGTVNAGDLVLGAVAVESNGTATGDSDTTNGSWSTAYVKINATGGTATARVQAVGQYKIPNASGAQTYNVTTPNTEWVAMLVVLQAEADPAITQAAYQFFDDAGTESGATSLGALNTAITGDLHNGNGYGVLRVRLQATTAVAIPSTDDFQLQWEKNASGTWTNVTTVSTTVQGYNNSNLTDGAATTNRLGAGTGSFVAGKISETGIASDVGWSASNYTELAYSLKLLASNYVAGDVLRFRVLRNGATTVMTYTQTPTINITISAPVVPGDVFAVASATVTNVNTAAVAHYGAGMDIDDLLAMFDPDGPRTSDAFCQAWWGKNAADCYPEILMTDRMIQFVRQASTHQAPAAGLETFYLKYLGGDFYGTCVVQMAGTDQGRRYWTGSDYPITSTSPAVNLATNKYNSISTLPLRNHLTSEFKNAEIDDFGTTRTADALGAGFRTQAGENLSNWVNPNSGTYGTNRLYWPLGLLANLDSAVLMYAVVWIVHNPGGGGELDHEVEDTHILNINAFGLIQSVAAFDHGVGSSVGYGCDIYEESTYTYVLFREYDPVYGAGTPNHFEDLTTDTTYHTIARIDTSGAQTVMNTEHTGSTFTYYQWWNGTTWDANSANAQRLKTTAGVDIPGDAAIARLGANDYIMCAQRYHDTARRVYKATSIQGPWTHIANVPTPLYTQEVVDNVWRTCIHMKIIPDMPAAAGKVMSLSHTMAFNAPSGTPAANPVTGRHINAMDIPYFIQIPTTADGSVGGKIKAWSGSAWVDKPVKVWTGSAWVEKPVKVWSGSAWVLS